MPTPHLQTYRGHSRAYGRRHPDGRTVAVAVIVALALAAGAFFAIRALIAEKPSHSTAPRKPAASDAANGASASATPTTSSVAPGAGQAAQRSRPATISISAVGDMLFDRKVRALIKAQGGDAPLVSVAAHLSNADVTVGNLETPLATSGTRNPVKEPQYAFRGHPAAIEGLKSAGFDAVSIANNHMVDYGPDALAETVASLDSAGIGHAGAGADTSAAWTPATIVLDDGTRVAYLAFTHILPPGYLAAENRAGVASGKMDMSLVTDAIKAARRDHDYVLVSFHWGVEYEPAANGDQVKKAHQAIDAGADMVLAHHPHVIQGVEYYRGKLIAYSLGDFVFDHFSRETGESFILDATLGPDGVSSATATPVYLDGYGAPDFVTGAEADVILSRLKKISAPLGTTVAIDGAKASILP